MIICCVHTKNILAHWKLALDNEDFLHVKTPTALKTVLKKSKQPLLLLHEHFYNNNLKNHIYDLYQEHQQIQILLLSDCPSYRQGKELLNFHIKGYGNSRMAVIHLQQAIRLIREGHIWLYPEFIDEMILEISTPIYVHQKNILKQLTEREQEIAGLVADGLTNKEVAQKTNITENTVKVHLRSIFEKMKVTDRLSLALLLR